MSTIQLSVNKFNPENVVFKFSKNKAKKPIVYLNYNDNGKHYAYIQLKIKNANVPFGCSKYPFDQPVDNTTKFSLQVDLKDHLTELENKLMKLEELYINYIVQELKGKNQKDLLSALSLKKKDLTDMNGIIKNLKGKDLYHLVKESDNEEYCNKFKIRVPFYPESKGSTNLVTKVEFYNKHGKMLNHINRSNITTEMKYGQYHFVFQFRNTYFISGKSGIPVDLTQVVLLADSNKTSGQCAFADELEDDDEVEEEQKEDVTTTGSDDEDDISESEE